MAFLMAFFRTYLQLVLREEPMVWLNWLQKETRTHGQNSSACELLSRAQSSAGQPRPDVSLGGRDTKGLSHSLSVGVVYVHSLLCIHLVKSSLFWSFDEKPSRLGPKGVAILFLFFPLSAAKTSGHYTEVIN